MVKQMLILVMQILHKRLLAVLLIASVGLNAYNYFISSIPVEPIATPKSEPKVKIQFKDNTLEFTVSKDTTLVDFKDVETKKSTKAMSDTVKTDNDKENNPK